MAEMALGTRGVTQICNAIRNDAGFLRRTRDDHMEDRRDTLYMQDGRRVFQQVVPLVTEIIRSHFAETGVPPTALKRLWLHQPNKTMNDLIGRKVLGRTPERHEQPNSLQDDANTSSTGSIIAFSKHSDDIEVGELGLISSLGAGHSAGSAMVKRMA